MTMILGFSNGLSDKTEALFRPICFYTVIIHCVVITSFYSLVFTSPYKYIYNANI